MRNLSPLLILVIFLSGSVSTRADSPTGNYFSGTEVSCPGIPGSAEATVIACNKIAYKDADRELNAAYRKLVAAADNNEKKFLQDMQRAWIKLKDAQCGLVESYYAGAQFPEKWRTECEAIMTIRRVKELKELGTGIEW